MPRHMKSALLMITAVFMFSNAFSEEYGAASSLGGASVAKTKKVSMDFENAALKDILKAFSRQAGVNFVASDVVEDKLVTVYLTEVSVEQALQSILLANNLTYEKKSGDVYLIKPEGSDPIKLTTRVYRFNYIQVYDMDMKPEGAGFGSVSGMTGSSSSGDSSDSSSTSTDSTSSDLTSTSSSASSSSDEAPKGIIDVLKALLSPHGKIVANRRTNTVIISEDKLTIEAFVFY